MPEHSQHKRPEHFARVTGSPGEVPRFAGFLRVIWPFMAIAFGAGYLLRTAWPFPPWHTTWIGGGFLALAGVLAWSVSLAHSRLQSFVKGAQGEEWVARTLSFLPAAYRVYHGLQGHTPLFTAGQDYDHVVVGPTGVFVIETKNWAGRISVRDGQVFCDGQQPDRPPLEQVKAAAVALSEELQAAAQRGVDVHPVLCFVEGTLPGGRAEEAGVLICTSHTLMDMLQEKADAPLPRECQEKVIDYLDQRTSATSV